MKKADKNKKAEYMDRVLMNVPYDITRLCYLAFSKDSFIRDYPSLYEYQMLNRRLNKLFKALTGLTEEELELLYLRYECGLKYSEIGRKMYMSKVTAFNKMRHITYKLYTAIYQE